MSYDDKPSEYHPDVLSGKKLLKTNSKSELILVDNPDYRKPLLSRRERRRLKRNGR